MKVPATILDALRDADINGNRLVLAGPRMTPRVYQQANEVLEAVGGHWTTRAQAHVFPGDAATAIAQVLASGTVVTLREKRQDAQYFPTPAPVVARLMALAVIEPGMEVLEPSAGSGAIATALHTAGATVDCIERDPGYAAILTAGAARSVRTADFTAVQPAPRYDRVVMNPPFTRGTDIVHVEHALRFLKPDGLLVAVMSWAVTYETRKTAAFRALVERRGGSVEAVPEKAFAESGTTVDTVIVTIPATGAPRPRPLAWPQKELPAVVEVEHRPPMEILSELKQNLRDAMAEFEAIERMLREPALRAEPTSGETVDLPLPREQQLAFDLGGAA